MAPTITKIGMNLKFLRRMRGMSQTELANKLGLSRNNIASYESGMVEPNSINFLKMASYFQVNPQDMLEKVLSENPTDIVPLEENPQNTIESYITEHMEDFTRQTNSITKILEGYQEFYNMRKDIPKAPNEKELFNSMENILELLQTLVSVNWKLIQTVFPNDNQ
jgi:transcriptional regulator with XRE-family HTH domain